MFIRFCLGKSLECGKILHVGAPQRLLSPSPLSYFSISERLDREIEPFVCTASLSPLLVPILA